MSATIRVLLYLQIFFFFFPRLFLFFPFTLATNAPTSPQSLSFSLFIFFFIHRACISLYVCIPDGQWSWTLVMSTAGASQRGRYIYMCTSTAGLSQKESWLAASFHYSIYDQSILKNYIFFPWNSAACCTIPFNHTWPIYIANYYLTQVFFSHDSLTLRSITCIYSKNKNSFFYINFNSISYICIL